MSENNNISKSADQAFSIYKKLLEKPCSKIELLNNFSEDTLQIYLATLRKLGMEINIPKKNYKNYVLKQTCFSMLRLSDNELKFISDIKKLLTNSENISDLINFNEFISELKKFTNDTVAQKLEEISLEPPLNYKEHSKLKTLQEAIQNCCIIVIDYNSPISAINYYKILPLELCLENGKIYLWSKDCTSDTIKYFRLERIEKIRTQKQKTKNLISKSDDNYAICELSGAEAVLFSENSKNEILERNGNNIKVKFYFKNEFNFLQKLAIYGENCKILEPQKLKSKFKQELSNIRKLYDSQV